MKLLYIGRVFSGLESSLVSGKWAPTGVPTIYKMIEALDRSSHDVRFVLSESGAGDKLTRGAQAEMALEGLKHPIKVLSGNPSGRLLAGRIGGKFAMLSRLRLIAREIESFDPDLVYVDRSNVLCGALAARRYRKPVLLRLMGIYPSMWEVLEGRSAFMALERWALRSPFAFALCTQDGTGGDAWMQAALAPGVARRMLLNGVELSPGKDQSLPPELAALPKEKMIVMFIGRLEDIKGWREFVEAILNMPAATKRSVHAVMIGAGTDKEVRDALVRQSGESEMFTLIDRVPHSQIHAVHRIADVYVSLNKLGNLSNANLECFRDGMCTIMPMSDPARGVDTQTDRLIPNDAAIRIPHDRLASALASELDRLVTNPEEIAARAGAMKSAARRCLISWRERIDAEMELLEMLANGADTRVWATAA